MIIPFVFTMASDREAPYLWYFYKWLEICKAAHWPMIAQEIYFNSPSYFVKQGRAESFNKSYSEIIEYHLPRNDDLGGVDCYAISDEMIEELIEEKGSHGDAYCFLLTSVYTPLANRLREIVLDIQQKHSEPIEAFAVLQHSPTLSAVVGEFGIPVVHLERGPFREKTYIKTIFWDLDNLHGGHTIEKRYQVFCEECEKHHIPIFNGRELLSLFLCRENLPLLDRVEREQPAKELGVALGYAIEPLHSCKTHLTDAELLLQAGRKYGQEHMLVRKHPFDPYGAQYPLFSACMEPRGKTAIDFILSCEAVATMASNVAMEAMFYGRRAYVFVPCPSYYASAHSFREEAVCASDQYLSFYALGYLAPHEMMTDCEYYRWRLSNPSEAEIYHRHLEFYLKKKGIPFSVLTLPPSERLEAMVAAQKG